MDEERKFKPEDRVVLKYGGPQMTMEDYLLGDVICNWKSGGKKVKGAFSETSLMLNPEEEKITSEKGLGKVGQTLSVKYRYAIKLLNYIL